MTDSLMYYCEPSELTSLETHRDALAFIPTNPAFICQIVQGLLVHGVWAKYYGFEADPKRECYGLSKMTDLLSAIIHLNPRSLSIARLPEERIIVCCRDFAALSCAMMRAKGIPARCRCGFATYMGWNGTMGDHWVVEYWNGERWVMNDPQVDPFQLGMMEQWGFNRVSIDNLEYDTEKTNTHDLSEFDFLLAGRAWLLSRTGKLDPEKCRYQDQLHGMWFIRGQLLRDFAALNKIEIFPHHSEIDWASWNLLNRADYDLTQEDLKLLDQIAALTLDADKNMDSILSTYEINPALHVPCQILKGF